MPVGPKTIDNPIIIQCCGSIILSLVLILLSLFRGMVMYDNEFETKENTI